ncbi:PREDICTED: sodium channel modifier 1-like [Branchiostoma belcheri]|uniref:Sodium channel modifier 1 n=1 Tax=Branchiostoma belcheri TaxID=7741 RepID=A0A6P4Y074_BRABE|nr:PREDICTED: sodium channel modifier 1-like [Branchiostoma belcheri]
MSFKREGDDRSQLNCLKKRRVTELLAEDIPDDEALLMKNGRLACLVCSHKPVFDTVDMLTVHRGGRKHLNNQQKFYSKKQELADLILKRKQEQFLSAQDQEDPAPLLTQTRQITQHALLTAATPYNPCVKQGRKKEEEQPKGKETPFFQKRQESSEERFVVQPYKSKREPVAPKQNNSQTPTSSSNSDSQSNFQNKTSTRNLPALQKVTTLQKETAKSTDHTKSWKDVQQQGTPKVVLGKKQKPVKEERKPELSEERRKEIAHHLKLTSSGWKRDRGGQWVKDEDVEFDSDEEEPPPPPL